MVFIFPYQSLCWRGGCGLGHARHVRPSRVEAYGPLAGTHSLLAALAQHSRYLAVGRSCSISPSIPPTYHLATPRALSSVVPRVCETEAALHRAHPRRDATRGEEIVSLDAASQRIFKAVNNFPCRMLCGPVCK